MAAHSLRMTQPAVTMQVQALEEYFGTKLFNRSTKKVELSEAGKALFPYAKRSIELMQEAKVEMSRFAQKLKGELQLGASLTFGEYILPRILGPFSSEHPHVSVSMKVMNTTQIVDEILNHQLTFGIVESLIHHPDVTTEAVLDDELKLILPPNHPLLAQNSITLDDVLGFPLILREQGSGTRQVIEESMLSKGIDLDELNIAMELGSTGAVKSAVESGLGVSIISQSAIKHELALGLLHARDIEGCKFVRSFYAVYLKSSLLPLSAVVFLTFLRDRDLSRWL